jgi:hypothetical protein
MRNVDGELPAVEKSPFSYPFKLTLAQVQGGRLSYVSRLLNFDTSELPIEEGWDDVLEALEHTLPAALQSKSTESLRDEIASFGEAAYIERIWLEDLASA